MDCCEYNEKNIYAKVESVGLFQTLDNKVVCSGLQIVKLLTYKEFKKLITCTIKTYHPNKQIKEECRYQNGKLNGAFTSWYQNGLLCDTGTYKNNRLYGIYKCWDSNGIVREYNY
jgi:antitoxin component YwqK of YwqJK toxin-antitoxin module